MFKRVDEEEASKLELLYKEWIDSGKKGRPEISVIDFVTDCFTKFIKLSMPLRTTFQDHKFVLDNPYKAMDRESWIELDKIISILVRFSEVFHNKDIIGIIRRTDDLCKSVFKWFDVHEAEA